MDEAVARVYDALYKNYNDPYQLRSILERVQEETHRQLRADARYLLLLNFSAMVIRPAETSGKATAEQMKQATIDDIRTIVGIASRDVREGEISGHEIIKALTSIWTKLKTMAYHVWD